MIQEDQLITLGSAGWGDVLLAVSLIFAAISWFVDKYKDRALRSEELRWKRTEFIFDQASLFDGDNEISEAVKIITGNDVVVSVEDLLNLNSAMLPVDRGNCRHKLDKLLNLMERIAFAYKNNILTIEDISHFEWYFLRVMEISDLNKYCSNYYPSILDAAKNLKFKSS